MLALQLLERGLARRLPVADQPQKLGRGAARHVLAAAAAAQRSGQRLAEVRRLKGMKPRMGRPATDAPSDFLAEVGGLPRLG
eukprot:4944912-Alexandrium_andersonii.AAC.1